MRRNIVLGSICLVIAFLAVGWWLYRDTGSTVAGLVPMEQVPAGLLATAQRELPGVKFDKVWRLKNGNYEIRGRDEKGKGREVELDPSGKVIEVD